MSLSFPRLLLVSLAFLGMPPLKAAEPVRPGFVEALNEGRKQRIVAYGTSLTANAEWPDLLKKHLSETYGRKVKFTNAALGGMDSRWGLANLKKRVLAEAPTVVLIEFAMNDALAQSKLSVEESTWNLEKMITTVRTQRPDCEVILMVMNPPTGKPLEERPGIRRYEAAYRRVARLYSCPLIDFSQRWQNIIAHHPAQWRSYAPDGIHPNKKASEEVILPQILEQLGLAQKSEDAPGKS